MATIRHHARIERSPEDVWKVVSDAGAISTWFPVIEESRAEGGIRSCTLQGGGELEEEIVTSDDERRRTDGRRHRRGPGRSESASRSLTVPNDRHRT